MMAIVVILIGIIAFMIGFIAGEIRFETSSLNRKITPIDIETETLMEEYRNFLNYNGDEQ